MSGKILLLVFCALIIFLPAVSDNNAFGKKQKDYKPGYLSWGLKDSQLVTYSAEQIKKFPDLQISPMNNKAVYSQDRYAPAKFAFYGYQLSESEPIYKLYKWGITGSYPYTITDLVERLAWTLPGKKMSRNRSQDYENIFYLGNPNSVIKVTGTFKTKDVPRDKNESVVFNGSFVLSNAEKEKDDPRYPANVSKLLEGIVNTEITFNQLHGYIEKVKLKFRFWYNWTKPEDKTQPQYNRNGRWEEVTFKKTGMLDLQNQGQLNDYITRAIRLSVDAISIAQSQENGAWNYGGHTVGATALCSLALLSSGVKPKEQSITQAFDYLYQQEIKNIYDAGLVCMAIEAKGIPESEWKLAAKHEVPKTFKRNLTKKDRELMEKAAKYILEHRATKHPKTGIGLWDYPGAKVTTRFDNSNSQYAVLGLYSAMRCNIDIPADVFYDIAKQFMEVQEPDGPFVNLLLENKKKKSRKTEPSLKASKYAVKARGWSYTIAPKRQDYKFALNMSYAYGSMTTSGITSLTIARAALAQMDKLSRNMKKEIKASLDSALAYMQIYYDMTTNINQTPRRHWYFYYLYGIERSGVLMQVNYFGKHHWYNEGAAILCLEQGRDGRWPGQITETAFALLFLKRATLPVYTGE